MRTKGQQMTPETPGSTQYGRLACGRTTSGSEQPRIVTWRPSPGSHPWRYVVTAVLSVLISSLAMDAHCADVAKPAGLYLSLSAADLGSTAWARQNGADEGNAFMRSDAVAKQLAVAGILTAADIHLQKKGHQRKLRVIVTALRVAAVVVNVSNARRKR